MISLFRRVLAAALLTTVALAPAVAHAQQKTTLKVGWTTSDGATDPYAVGARAFKKEVEERTGGRVEVQLFPNRQLGDERPMLDGMRLGTVDGGVITNGVIAQIEPAFQINDMPFLYKDEAQAQRILDGAVGRGLATRLETKGVVLLGFMEGGFRHMINNVRPVNTPDDVKGVKYRVLQNPLFIEMFRSLGGNAVPMAWGETFTAVQQGAIDGLEIPLAVIDGSKFNEVTKFLSLTNHTYSMIGLVLSKRTFDRLPEDVRKQVAEAGLAATAAQRQAAGATARELVGTLKGKGVQVNEVADLAPFRKAVLPMYENFRGQIGADVVQEALTAVQ